MEKTLEKKSGILFLKSKFFIIRVFTYFSFLLIPIWVQKSLNMNALGQVLLMSLYTVFMVSQWFLLGKEIDHRLKIYFRVNSSMDRVVYRLYLGMFFLIIVFSAISFLPNKWIYNTFWIVWIVLGIFYSWPTRGKIIKESVSTHFGEYRYLDSFEKTLVALIMIMLFVSFPELPKFTDSEALKLFFDPNERVHSALWNFVTVTYFPFYKYSHLFKIGWSIFFYYVVIGFFLLNFYALLRFFVSRRISLLGVFAFVSSWSFSKILATDFGLGLSTTYSLLWIWSILWATKSGTYRSGLFLGLVSFYGTIIDQSWILLAVIQVIIIKKYLMRDKSDWYHRQVLRYISLGLVCCLVTALSAKDIYPVSGLFSIDYLENITRIFKRKAFYSLSIFGIAVFAIKLTMSKFKFVNELKFKTSRIDQLFILLIVLLVSSIFLESTIIKDFTVMWVMCIFSLLPLELIFQNISRLRSSRNMIYLIYILICLLDSHFEGRVKIFMRIFS